MSSIILSGYEIRGILDGSVRQIRRAVKHQPPCNCHFVMNQDGTKALCMANPDVDVPEHPWFVPPNPKSADRFVRCPHPTGSQAWVKEAFWIEHDSDCNECSPAFDCGINIAEDDWARVQYCATPNNPERPDEPGDWFGPDDVFEERTWIPWGGDCASLVPQFYSKHPSVHLPRRASRLTITFLTTRCQHASSVTEDDAIAEGCDGYYSPPYVAGGEIVGPDGQLPTEELSERWDAEPRNKRHPWSPDLWTWAWGIEPATT